eukprot:16450358-Heterocapsa_arctica.AAC.1
MATYNRSSSRSSARSLRRRRSLRLHLMESRTLHGQSDLKEFRSACTTATWACAMECLHRAGSMRACSSLSRRARPPMS